jgi:hypothetical protein
MLFVAFEMYITIIAPIPSKIVEIKFNLLNQTSISQIYTDRKDKHTWRFNELSNTEKFITISSDLYMIIGNN